MRRRWHALLLIIVGSALLAVDTVGLFVDYRVRQGVPRPVLPPHAEELRRGNLFQRSGESDRDYFRRLTYSVHYRMTPWSEVQAGGNDAPALTDNWPMWLGGFVSDRFRRYDFVDHRRALERGYGLCSQYARIVFDVLREQGFKRRLVLWAEHAVVTAKMRAGPWYVLDADLRVLMPYSLERLRREPNLLRQYHSSVEPATSNLPPSWTSDDVANWARRFYRRPPDQTLVDHAYPTMWIVEPLAYLLKWVLPVAVLLAGGWLLWRVPTCALRSRP